MKNKLMFLLARIFGKKIETIDITETAITRTTGYHYKGVLYITKQEVDSMERYCGVDIKGIKSSKQGEKRVKKEWINKEYAREKKEELEAYERLKKKYG